MADKPDYPFSLTRIFDAPAEAVFQAWTLADAVKEWWGPKSHQTIVAQLDLQPGGIFHYCFQGADGQKMWGKFVYHEIAAPQRLVFVNSFSDESGHTTRAPFSPSWPLEMINVLTLVEEMGKTTLTLQGNVINASPDEQAIYLASVGSMQQSFTSTFDQLEAFLEKGK